MAPATTPGRKKRENQFFEVGVQGRKTGITLKDTGVRDEYGMEPLEGIFSSPEKSPAKLPSRTASRNINTTLTSEEMAEARSSAPEPAEVLTGRRNTKTVFPPPFGRSPIKTAIGSSPKRQSSVGPLSPMRALAQSPLRSSRAGSQPAVVRKLDFSAQGEPVLKSVDINLQRNSARRSRLANKPRRDIFADSASPEQNGTHFMNIPEEPSEAPTPEPQLNGYNHSSPALHYQDDSLQLLDQHIDPNEVLGSIEDVEEVTQANDRLLSDKLAHNLTTSNIRHAGQVSGPGTQRSSRMSEELERALRQGSDNSANDEAYQPPLSHDEEETEPAEHSPPPPLPKKGRGRPRKSDVIPAAAFRGTKRKALKPAPPERGPNAKIGGAKRQKSVDSLIDRASAQENRRPGPRSLQVLRQGTPADEHGTQTTRFGRASVKPVAWWCGERVDRDYDGTIRNIVRATSVEPAKRARNQSKRPPKAMPEMGALREEEEEDEDIEDWELDPGVIGGQVRAWDPEQNVGVEESDNEQNIAFAANAIETRDVAGANFKYSKVLSLPFFGSGLVDIPPNGFKSAKNSRKMEMVFMVHMGKVLVRVEDIEFTISKGGVWRVPRVFWQVKDLESVSEEPVYAMNWYMTLFVSQPLL